MSTEKMMDVYWWAPFTSKGFAEAADMAAQWNILGKPKVVDVATTMEMRADGTLSDPVNLATTKLVPMPVAQDGYEVTTADGIWIKQYVFPLAGMIIPQHSHVWDHSTAIVRGAIYVWRDGEFDRKYEAPTVVFIKAGVKHTFKTIEDDTVILCLHNAMRPDVAAVLEEHQLEFG